MICMNKKVLITGVSGLLGANLALYFRDENKVLGLYRNHEVEIPGIKTEQCDLMNTKPLDQTINRFNPDIIIHCASLTDVDKCETTNDITNVEISKNLVDSINGKLKLIFISTDSVYDGNGELFSETDNNNPCNVYGKGKLESEGVIKRIKNSLILRTNIFGWNIQNKKSLAEWILSQLMKSSNIVGFQDAYFSSIYTFELARAIDIAIQKDLSGVYNCASSNYCSKYEFALKLADQFNLNRKLIDPISIDDHNFIAQRGKNLSLNVKKFEDEANYKLPTIEYSLERFYRDFQSGLPLKIEEGAKSLRAVFPVVHSIPYGRQFIDQGDINEVLSVLKSTNLTQGPKITEFENALEHEVDSKYAVAVNSGTSALHIACLSIGLSKGDEVITSPNTFVASANCAVFCGATPIFADIDSQTYNIDAKEIEKKLTKKTKAVIPVHFAGQSADMEAIHKVVRAAETKFGHRIYIIEDASHALGSKFEDSKVGSGKFSDLTVFSFHPVKHITTAEGGAVVTQNRDLYRDLRLFSSHGITRDPHLLRDNYGPWYYEQVKLGYNYRITDVQCALGISQLRKLSYFAEKRKEIVKVYNNAFDDTSYLTTPYESNKCDSNFHLYVVKIKFEQLGMSRNQFMDKLVKKGIITQIHYIPVHTQPFYRENFATNWGDCTIAEEYFKECISLPLYPAMHHEDVGKVINDVKNILEGAV